MPPLPFPLLAIIALPLPHTLPPSSLPSAVSVNPAALPRHALALGSAPQQCQCTVAIDGDVDADEADSDVCARVADDVLRHSDWLLPAPSHTASPPSGFAGLVDDDEPFPPHWMRPHRADVHAAEAPVDALGPLPTSALMALAHQPSAAVLPDSLLLRDAAADAALPSSAPPLAPAPPRLLASEGARPRRPRVVCRSAAALESAGFVVQAQRLREAGAALRADDGPHRPSAPALAVMGLIAGAAVFALLVEAAGVVCAWYVFLPAASRHKPLANPPSIRYVRRIRAHRAPRRRCSSRPHAASAPAEKASAPPIYLIGPERLLRAAAGGGVQPSCTRCLD